MPPITNAETARLEIFSIETLSLTAQQFLLGAKDGTPARIGAELRLPPGTSRIPAVVLIHGSGGVGANVDGWAQALNAMGIATLMADDGSVAAIEQSIILIGDRIGRGGAARRLATGLRAHFAAVAERLKGAPRRAVLMVVGHQPMVAVGQGTYLSELLMMAGATNIAAASDQAWPRLSVEYIIASRPEVILDGQMGSDPSTPSAFWSKYPTIPAVKNHRVVGYPEDPTLHPGPRIGVTLDELARLIHPEAFRLKPGFGAAS